METNYFSISKTASIFCIPSRKSVMNKLMYMCQGEVRDYQL